MSGRERAGIRAGAAAALTALPKRYARRAGAVGAVALLAVLATGVGVAVSKTSRTVVEIGHLGDGLNTSVIASGSGRSLYMSTGDRNGRSSCYGKCTTVWQPYLAHGRLVAGKGVNAKRLGKTRRRNGTYQVTYNRHPLYLFVKQHESPGAWDGQGCGISGSGDSNHSDPHWWLLTPRGYANKSESGFCQSVYQGVSG